MLLMIGGQLIQSFENAADALFNILSPSLRRGGLFTFFQFAVGMCNGHHVMWRLLMHRLMLPRCTMRRGLLLDHHLVRIDRVALRAAAAVFQHELLDATVIRQKRFLHTDDVLVLQFVHRRSSPLDVIRRTATSARIVASVLFG